MITDRIGLHSVLLPALIEPEVVDRSQLGLNFLTIFDHPLLDPTLKF